MKRILTLIVALLLLCSFNFAGCEKKEQQADDQTTADANTNTATNQSQTPANTNTDTNPGTQSSDGNESEPQEKVYYSSAQYTCYICGDWMYDLVSEIENTINIIGYSGDASDLTIPQTISGRTVTQITSLNHNTTVEILRLPDTLQSIGNGFMMENTHIRELYCGNGALTIGDRAFLRCSNLEKVVLSPNLISVGTQAFGSCKFKQILIPGSVLQIGSYAFANNKDLTQVEFEEGLTTIDYGAFLNCTGLETITIPASVTTILGNAFGNGDDIFAASSDPPKLETVHFLGDAPTFSDGAEPFGPANSNITIYYPANTSGWDTTPLKNLYTLCAE